MINVVIPMAGAGSRFTSAGYEKPKPFIDVGGEPMIVRVLENLACPNARYILLARESHLASEEDLVHDIARRFNATFVPIDKLTEGTACTVLYARKVIGDETPLLIANSDQIIDIPITAFLEDSDTRKLDGSILTFVDPRRDPKWSFARLGEDGYVVEVQEKQPISEHATVGIYYFRRGRDFVDSAIDMVVRQDKINGEYYTCPVYNYLIGNGGAVGIFDIPRPAMHGIGTPEDLAAYLASGSHRGQIRLSGE